ncbi:MAG: helix-turn-helix transcriptional regulator [Armatimonadaceae bacterium]
MDFRSDLDAMVLGVLQDTSLHGYEITRRINERSTAFRIKEGQLYPILHRLENEGHIAATWVPQEGKPDRKVYRLTDSGLNLLERKKRNWSEFVASVTAVLTPAKGENHAS